jgi:hypothetical protein
MPANYKKTATITQVEILRFPSGLEAIASVVLDSNDSTAFPAPTDGSRFVVPVGTILALSASTAPASRKLYTRYQGGGSGPGPIQGILGHSVDMVANVTEGMEAAPMFFHNCVFATEAIVGFTQYASALMNDLKFCQFK